MLRSQGIWNHHWNLQSSGVLKMRMIKSQTEIDGQSESRIPTTNFAVSGYSELIENL